jgi:hypothetical protein
LANRPLFLTLEQSHPITGKKRCASAQRDPCNASASDGLIYLSVVDESPWRHRSRSGQLPGEGDFFWKGLGQRRLISSGSAA